MGLHLEAFREASASRLRQPISGLIFAGTDAMLVAARRERASCS